MMTTENMREHFATLPPEAKKRFRVEARERLLLKAPPAAKAMFAAHDALFWAPERPTGESRETAIQLFQAGIEPTVILDIVTGKAGPMKLTIDTKTEPGIGDVDRRNFGPNARLADIQLRKVNRQLRKEQERWAAHNARMAWLAVQENQPDELLRRAPSARHEIGHLLTVLGAFGEVVSIEAFDIDEGGGGLIKFHRADDTTHWQRICIAAAGAAAEQRTTINHALNNRESYNEGSDAQALHSLLRDYFYVSAPLKQEADLTDLLGSRELAAVGFEVQSYLDDHNELLDELTLMLARAKRIDETTSPVDIIAVMDAAEKRLKPLPRHPQSWAVAQLRNALLQSNIRLARGDVAREHAIAEYEAEKSALSAACQRWAAAALAAEEAE